MAYKIYSFFSGSGFLDLGFEKNGFQIELVNEYLPAFMEAYKYSREKMGIPSPTFGYFNIDINEFLSARSSELRKMIKESHEDGSLVGFIGGPPCPDFSVAGKNRGRYGDNGKLSKSYVDLICLHKPDFFLFENVKGLWKTKRHREFFEELKMHLHDSGYITTEKLVNAIEYGAPQERERILLFGIKKSLIKSKDLECFDWDYYKKHSLEKIKKMPWPTVEPFKEEGSSVCPKGILKKLTVEYWFKLNDVEHHKNANDFFIPRAGISRMKAIEEGDVSKKSYKRLHRWRYSPTVAYGNNEVHLHPYKARRLSVAEALALQTLPKEFELPQNMTLTDKFKTIGNGVPYVLSKSIAKTIYTFLDNNCSSKR